MSGKDGCVGKEVEGQIEKDKKMNPEVSKGSSVKGPSGYGGQNQDVRPKLGNRRGNPNRDQRGQRQMPQNPTGQGQGQSSLGQYRQNSGNQGQYQQGRNAPGGRGGNPRGKLFIYLYFQYLNYHTMP